MRKKRQKKKQKEEEEEEEDYEEVEEVTIQGVNITDVVMKNGIIYEYLDDGDCGDELGKLQNGILFLS